MSVQEQTSMDTYLLFDKGTWSKWFAEKVKTFNIYQGNKLFKCVFPQLAVVLSWVLRKFVL